MRSPTRRRLFPGCESSLAALLGAVLRHLCFRQCCALGRTRQARPGKGATSRPGLGRHPVFAGWSKPSLGRRGPEKPLARPSVPSTGQWPELKVHVEFGSEESDLLRNRDTHVKPFMPTTQPLLWPTGSPALSERHKSCSHNSFFVVSEGCLQRSNCAHVFPAFLTHGEQPQNGSPRE